MAENNLTLAIIKPDAVRAGNTWKIIDRIIAVGHWLGDEGSVWLKVSAVWQ